MSSANPSVQKEPGSRTPKPDHITDFLRSVSTRERPLCNEDEAFIETAVLMMSHESFRLKRQVRWDAENEEIV